MSLFHKKDTKREVFGQMFTELYPRLCATPPNYWATEKKPVILWVV